MTHPRLDPSPPDAQLRGSLDALRLSEARYRALATNLPDTSVFLFDHDLRYVLADGASLRDVGLSKEAIEGRTIWEFLPADLCERLAPRHRAALEGRVVDYEDVYNGHTYAVQLLPIRDAGGAIIYGMGVSTDITKRKRAEQAVRESEEQLRNLAARLEAIREEERTRIAREIHDQFGQALTAFKMDLAWLAKKVPDRPAALRPKLQDMEAVIDATMDAMHRIVAELRPGVLDDLGLPAAIRWLATDFQARTHLPCAVSVTGTERSLATAQATAVFRILQEALTNIARHARARHVGIRFHVVPTALELVVADDGRGITADEGQSRRTFGLLGIRERALTWHGQVTVHGEPGRGTTVRVFMPIA